MFAEYVAENHRYFQRKLVVQMIKTEKELDEIVQDIIEGKRVKPPATKESPGPGSYQKMSDSPSRLRFATTTKKVQIDLKVNRNNRDLSKGSRLSNQSPTRTRISFRDTVQPQSMQVRSHNDS